MGLMLRPCAERPGSSAALLVLAVGCALVAALAMTAGRPAAVAPTAGPAYTLMQMNLCLSGLAGCYRKVAYPRGGGGGRGPVPRGAPGRGDDQRGLRA